LGWTCASKHARQPLSVNSVSANLVRIGSQVGPWRADIICVCVKVKIQSGRRWGKS